VKNPQSAPTLLKSPSREALSFSLSAQLPLTFNGITGSASGRSPARPVERHPPAPAPSADPAESPVAAAAAAAAAALAAVIAVVVVVVAVVAVDADAGSDNSEVEGRRGLMLERRGGRPRSAELKELEVILSNPEPRPWRTYEGEGKEGGEKGGGKG
jgi:hypothetical protein